MGKNHLEKLIRKSNSKNPMEKKNYKINFFYLFNFQKS